jgi:hypothetical protein
MVSQLPPPEAGVRYEASNKKTQSFKRELLHHFTGESVHELAHSSNLVRGSHEEVGEIFEVSFSSKISQKNCCMQNYVQGVRTSYNQAVREQFLDSAAMRQSNTDIHTGTELRHLIRRDNTNSTQQPLYPVSVVNDSFRKHLEAKAIDAG